MMTNNEIQADSPISYTVEEGKISSGAASPATIVETHTMDTSVQTTSQPSPRIHHDPNHQSHHDQRTW